MISVVSVEQYESGATIVEFSLVALLMITIFGAFTDIGLGIHRYALLKQVTTEATRELGARLQTRKDCTEIPEYLRNSAEGKLISGFGVREKPSWRLRWTGSGQFRRMQISSSLPINCYFLCAIMPKNWSVHASSDVVVDSSVANLNNNDCRAFSLS